MSQRVRGVLSSRGAAPELGRPLRGLTRCLGRSDLRARIRAVHQFQRFGVIDCGKSRLRPARLWGTGFEVYLYLDG